MTPRSLDEARRLLPNVGISIYAMTPGGPVTLELLEAGATPDEPPQAMTWEAPTELEAWEKAFPHPAIPSAVEALFGPEPDPTAGLAAELAAALSGPAESLFD